jgi:hypothetical protein
MRNEICIRHNVIFSCLRLLSTLRSKFASHYPVFVNPRSNETSSKSENELFQVAVSIQFSLSLVVAMSFPYKVTDNIVALSVLTFTFF